MGILKRGRAIELGRDAGRLVRNLTAAARDRKIDESEAEQIAEDIGEFLRDIGPKASPELRKSIGAVLGALAKEFQA
jgi:hypothetical protein